MKQTIIIISVAAFLLFLMYSSRDKFSHDVSRHPILLQVRENFGKISSEYTKIPLREGDSAYTENKEVITLCLKDPATGKYYDMNTIMYVALHELAHVICEAHGHGEEFKKKFAKLLRYAAKIHIYDPKIGMSHTYCGLNNQE